MPGRILSLVFLKLTRSTAFVDRLASYLSGRGSRLSALNVGDAVDLRPDPAVRGSADVLAPDGTHPLVVRQAEQVRTWPLPAASI